MEKRLNYKEGTLFYSTHGKGRPVMLIHGFASDGSEWEKQIPALHDHFQLIVPDLPGSGLSDFNTNVHSMEDHADALAEIITDLELEKATLIGHSMGGYIALAFAEKYPEKLNALGLFHSSAYADTEEKKATRKKGIEFIKEHGVAKFQEQTIPNLFSDLTRKNNPGLVEEIIARFSNLKEESLVDYYQAMMERPDRSSVLKNIGNPVLFIAGEGDKTIPLNLMLEQSHLPGLSYFHILKNSGHMGMLEETDSSNLFLEKFLRTIE
jgi:pimeloyl-ACP methyl ester carboxylesterase